MPSAQLVDPTVVAGPRLPPALDEKGVKRMPQSELRLVQQWAEFRPQDEIVDLPRRLRGIYVLYRHRNRGRADKYDVVYVGMARAGRRGGIRGRLNSHLKRKGDLWTHWSAFVVWDNIRDDEVLELEGLFRHIYRRDSRANRLNVQRGFKKLVRIQRDDVRSWPRIRSNVPPKLVARRPRRATSSRVRRSRRRR